MFIDEVTFLVCVAMCIAGICSLFLVIIFIAGVYEWNSINMETEHACIDANKNI